MDAPGDESDPDPDPDPESFDSDPDPDSFDSDPDPESFDSRPRFVRPPTPIRSIRSTLGLHALSDGGRTETGTDL